MMSEMKEPTEFVRSLHVATPILVLIYAVVAVMTFGACGEDTPEYMLDALPTGSVIKRIVGVLLFGHTVVSYTINQQVLARNMHILIFQNQEGAPTGACRTRVQWFGITTVQLGVAFVLATSVGNFENIVHLIGALFVAPLCYILPLACLLAVPLSTEGFQRPCAEAVVAWVLLFLSVVLLVVGTIAAVLPIVNGSK
jgi:amino acid permease